MTSPPPVAARGLVKRYGDIVAVDHVDLTVEPGDVFGYLGPNGAGKTTSLRMMLGLIRPTAGTARLFGRDPQRDGAKALAGVAGFVEEPRFYPYLSGRTNLELCAAYDGGDARERIGEVLDAVDLADRARDKVGGYSHGMKQRLGIAAALLLAHGVVGAESVDGEIRFRAEPEEVEAISIVLGRAGVGISSLVPHSATLEELFLGMTEQEAVA